MMMKETYTSPVVRVVDLTTDHYFCMSDPVSGGLEKTYDDEIDF